MEQIIKCVIAGGPQHGLIHERLWDSALPALSTADGELCVAAAHRSIQGSNSYYVLLHPRATGRQFLDILSKLDTLN